MKRLLQDIRKYRWVILGCFGIFFIARWAYARGKPQSVMPIPEPVQVVRNGKIFQSVRDPYSDRVFIKAAPASGGSPVTLATEDISAADIRSFTVAGDSLYYVRSPKRMRPDPGRLPPAPNSGPVRNLRSATMPPQALNVRTPTLRRLPLDGGAATDVPVVLRPGVVIAGSNLYWVDPKPDKVTPIPGKSEEAALREPQSDLVTVPIAGGPEKRLANATLQRSRLQPSGDAVFWFTPTPGTEDKDDLNGVTGADFTRIHMKEYTGEGVPVVLDKALFWLEQVEPDPKKGTPGESHVVTAGFDGSGRKMLFKQSTDALRTGQSAWTYSNLKPHKGYLYVLASRTADRTTSDRTHPATLFRYKPGGPEELQKVYEFQEHVATNTFFDDDYYYYSALEEHENWFSFSDIFIHRVPMLYRYRLPD